MVAEALPSVAIKRDCVKYGSFMSGSRLERVFIFDASAKKYRYYRSKEESKDVAEKSMNLARGEYEIQDKVPHYLNSTPGRTTKAPTENGTILAEPKTTGYR